MKYLFNSPAALESFLYGFALVGGVFLLILGVFKLFGGDKGQSKRSDWFPLVYILPAMALLLLWLMHITK